MGSARSLRQGTRPVLETAALGLLLLCLGAGSILSMPLAGTLAARFGCRRVLILSSGYSLYVPAAAGDRLPGDLCSWRHCLSSALVWAHWIAS